MSERNLRAAGSAVTKPFSDGTHSKIGFQATEKVADWKRQGRRSLHCGRLEARGRPTLPG
jgi:CDGSH-type Zn-finger protein